MWCRREAGWCRRTSCALRVGHLEYHQPTSRPQRRTPAEGRASRECRRATRQPRELARFFEEVGFFATVAFFFAEVDFFELTLDLADRDERADTFDFDFELRDDRAERDELAELRPRRLRAERERAACSGRFQPTARSARKDAGMLSRPSCESVTASAAASARSARTSLITFAGRRARAACTRSEEHTSELQ